MTIARKAIISLLISLLLTIGFAFVAWSGFFKAIEKDFFNKKVSSDIKSSVKNIAASADEYHDYNIKKFTELLSHDFIQKSFMANQSAEDISNRTKSIGELTEKTPGLAGIRFIDQDGKRIQFSTFASDIIKSSNTQIVYRNYGEDNDEPYKTIAALPNSIEKITALEAPQLFAYSFKFIDRSSLYRGTAVFYVTLSGLSEWLIKHDHIALSDSITPIGLHGLVFSAPKWANAQLKDRIQQIWLQNETEEPIPLGSSGASDSFVLFSTASKHGYISRLAPSTWFIMPDSFKAILIAVFFCSVYLLVFLIFNFRQDPFTALATRIKRFQIELLSEYIERKGTIDLDRWQNDIEAHRTEMHQRIRKSAGRLLKKRSADVDALIDKSWDEIIAIITARAQRTDTVDMARIEAMLKEIVKQNRIAIQTIPASTKTHAKSSSVPEDLPELEALDASSVPEDLPELEALDASSVPEDLPELEALDASSVPEDLPELEALDASSVPEEVPELEALDTNSSQDDDFELDLSSPDFSELNDWSSEYESETLNPTELRNIEAYFNLQLLQQESDVTDDENFIKSELEISTSTSPQANNSASMLELASNKRTKLISLNNKNTENKTNKKYGLLEYTMASKLEELPTSSWRVLQFKTETPEELPLANSDNSAIVFKDGVYTINKKSLLPSNTYDTELKALADSVLGHDRK